MGLFSRSKKPKYLEEDFTGLMKSYSDFASLIRQELSPGSRDMKKTTVVLSDRTGEVYHQNGLVKAVIDPTLAFSLPARLFWEGEASHEVKSEVAGLSTENDRLAYLDFRKVMPQEASLLREIYHHLSLQSAHSLNKALEAQGAMPVETNIVLSEQLTQLLLGWDFLEVDGEQFLEELTTLEEDVTTSLHFMEVKETPWEEVTLVEGPQGTQEAEDSLGRYVASAAENEVTLQVFHDYAGGFPLGSLFKALKEALVMEEVRLRGVKGLYEEDLPELSTFMGEEYQDEMLDFTSLSEALEGDGALHEALAEVLEEEEDDWRFDANPFLSERENHVFTPTAHLDLPLLPLVERVLAVYSLSGEERNKVQSNLEDNLALEAEVTRLEVEINLLSRAYSRGVKHYDEMKFERNLEQFEDENDEAESERESTEENPAMLAQRATSNNDFFILEKLEELRFEKNDLRKKLLYGAMGHLPFEGEDRLTVEVQDIIELKLKGIEGVRNLAFHPQQVLRLAPYRPEAKAIPRLLLPPKEGEFKVSLLSPDTREAHPHLESYYALVERLGRDPLAEYKEEVRLRAGILFTPLTQEELFKLASEAMEEEEEALAVEELDPLLAAHFQEDGLEEGALPLLEDDLEREQVSPSLGELPAEVPLEEASSEVGAGEEALPLPQEDLEEELVQEEDEDASESMDEETPQDIPGEEEESLVEQEEEEGEPSSLEEAHPPLRDPQEEGQEVEEAVEAMVSEGAPLLDEGLQAGE